MVTLLRLQLGTALLLFSCASWLNAQQVQNSPTGKQPAAIPSPQTTGTAALAGQRISYCSTFNPDWHLVADFKGSSVTVECSGPWESLRSFSGDLEPMDYKGLVVRGSAAFNSSGEPAISGKATYYFDINGQLAGVTWFVKGQKHLFTKWACLPPGEEKR